MLLFNFSSFRFGVQPYKKNSWCKENLNWDYVKCNTRKSLQTAHASNELFRAMVTDWTRYSIKVDENDNEPQVKKYDNIFGLPKSDEFVDTLVLLKIGSRNCERNVKSNQTTMRRKKRTWKRKRNNTTNGAAQKTKKKPKAL